MTDHSILRFYSPFFKSQCFIKRWVESLKYGTISSLWDSVKFNEPQLAEYDLHKACTVSYLGTKVIPVDAPMVMPIAKVKNNVTVWKILVIYLINLPANRFLFSNLQSVYEK